MAVPFRCALLLSLVTRAALAQTCKAKAAGQKSVLIPGGKGVGCNAGGVKDCCYCVYDMAACVNAFGRGPCQATNEARSKQGFDGCDPKTAPEPAPTVASTKQCSDVKAAGQRALNIRGGKGVGCRAGGLKDCCYCVYNMTKCEKAFGRGPCQATNEARSKQGFDGCDPIEMAPEPASTVASAKQCSDVKAAGQRALNIPGGKGVGCRAGGLKDCCYCVYNMTKCEKAFGRGPCQATNEARSKQGFDGCDPIEMVPEPAPTVASAKQCSDVKAAGQRALNIPGGKGVGCHAGGLKDCCYCVDDMAACEKAFGKACQATNEARRKDGFDGCNPMSEIIV